MKGLRIWVMALGLGALLAPTCFGQLHWETRKIIGGHTWATGGPVKWGDAVYYNDRRTGNNDVYVWTEAAGEQPLISGADSVAVWGVYENKLAVTKYVNSQYDLYLYDPLAGLQPISTAAGSQYNADMYGDLVVYEDNSTGVPQVWAWDPVNGNRPLDPTGKPQNGPRVYNGRVVWTDGRNYSPYNERTDVYSWTAEEGVTRLSTAYFSAGGPDIFGDRVAMHVYDTIYPDPEGTWEWREGQGISPLLPGVSGNNLRMWGDLLAWPGSGGPVVYYPALGVTHLATSGTVYSLDVYGNSVVWADNYYDIWMAELVPEPSAFFTLASFAGLLVSLRRRRQK